MVVFDLVESHGEITIDAEDFTDLIDFEGDAGVMIFGTNPNLGDDKFEEFFLVIVVLTVKLSLLFVSSFLGIDGGAESGIGGWSFFDL